MQTRFNYVNTDISTHSRRTKYFRHIKKKTTKPTAELMKERNEKLRKRLLNILSATTHEDEVKKETKWRNLNFTKSKDEKKNVDVDADNKMKWKVIFVSDIQIDAAIKEMNRIDDDNKNSNYFPKMGNLIFCSSALKSAVGMTSKKAIIYLTTAYWMDISLKLQNYSIHLNFDIILSLTKSDLIRQLFKEKVVDDEIYCRFIWIILNTSLISLNRFS